MRAQIAGWNGGDPVGQRVAEVRQTHPLQPLSGCHPPLGARYAAYGRLRVPALIDQDQS
ncbi:hypothetical protein [Streptomyces tubercidicus]|uniref:hypothetical protein n=1 Tax=Streptomyces tubercidicus TaxID=47759 RepID=UPI003465ADD9